MGYMVSSSAAGVDVMECDTCNECPVAVVVDGVEVKEFNTGELALQDAERHAGDIRIKRIHVDGTHT